MSDTDIDKLEGRELDFAIAVEVFGWEWFKFEKHFEPPRGYEWWRSLRSPASFYRPDQYTKVNSPGNFELADGNEPVDMQYGEIPWCPKFSSDIAAAKQALAKLWQSGKFMSVRSGWWINDAESVIVPDAEVDCFRVNVICNSDPIAAECIAICRCCLKAARWLKEQSK